jgi:hypothetical protein
MRKVFELALATLCMAGAAFAGVTVSSPTAGSSVSSPVHFVASASSTSAVTAMKIYVDNNVAFSTSSSKLDTNVTMSAGSHYVVVQAWDSSGNVLKTPMNITVSSVSSGGGGSSPIPSTAKVFSNIDQMTGWQSCNSCAGPGGAGAAIPYSMTQNQSSPSMDGNSVKFSVSGSSAYGAALWWKQLGADATKRNFVYDLYFYMTTPLYSQALEFDMNQAVGGLRYIFGTQCDYRDHKTWDVFDGVARRWVSTGIACTPPSAYAWHHVVLEFQRTTDDKAKFIAVTLDGKKSYFNKTFAPHSSSVNELNVAFQMDQDGKANDYSTWVDKVKMSAW